MAQVVRGRDRRLVQQDQGGVSDLPLGGLKPGSGTQPELVEQDSGNRVGVRVVGHLPLPVSCDRPAVQLGGADLPVHVGRDFPVMLGPERTRQLGLHRLRRAEGGVQPGMLSRERLIAFIDLVREEDGLGLAVRPERDRLRCRTLPPEPCQDPGKSLPDLRQRVHVNGHRTVYGNSVLKLVQLQPEGDPLAPRLRSYPPGARPPVSLSLA
jgi:hypothetical protein